MRFSSDAVDAVHKLLKTGDDDRNIRLLRALRYAASSERSDLIYRTFPVKKASGGFRMIVNATEILNFIQYEIRQMMRRRLKTVDMNESGKGVYGAVKPHLKSKFAVVLDIEGAYDNVTSKLLRKAFSLYLRNEHIPDEALDFICYLITYPLNGRDVARQGFVSSQTAFNWQMHEADKALKFALWGLSIHQIIFGRYADNIIASSKYPFDYSRMIKAYTAILGEAGFKIGWWKLYTSFPIKHLGTEIWSDRLVIDENKEGEHIDRILMYLESDRPWIYRDNVTGIYNWAHKICGENIPPALLRTLWRYYMKVGNPPTSLQKMMEHKLNYRMF